MPITPGGSEGGMHCCVITANALGKAFQFGNAAVLGLDKPFIQIIASTFREHRDKGLTELIGRIQITVPLADVCHLLALLLVKLFRLADIQPRCACGSQAAYVLRW